MSSSGPLSGVRVVEMGAIGPVPFAGMLLADMGADVVRIDRPTSQTHLTPVDRGRRSVAVDVKSPAGRDLVLDLVAGADILLEGFRPGVMERLGLGPDVALARRPSLVYGRMTGFGQEGPLAHVAGHDINYIALAGALELIGDPDRPPAPPLNVLGDFGGGGMLLGFGVLAALHHARAGRGQVVDASMIDGVGLLMAMFHGLRSDGMLGPRGTNGLDGGAPYYRTYRTSDDRWMAVGAIEEPFYQGLLHGLGLDPAAIPDRGDRSTWPELTVVLERAFGSRTRDEWSKVFSEVDGCVSPVLGLGEIATHPHHVAHGSLQDVAGLDQPAPAPRLSATPGAVQGPPPRPGEHTRQALADWGVPESTVRALLDDGVLSSLDG